MSGLLKLGAEKKVEEAHEKADAKFGGDSLIQRALNAGTVISVVVIGVVALVGILIFGQVWEAINIVEGDPMYEEANSVIDGFGSAMEFVPIILLVLLASVVIAVVQRMRM